MSAWHKVGDKVSERYELTFMRLLDAPVERVWQAWSEPGCFMRWWGPGRFTSRVSRMDFRTGGRFFWSIRSPEGRDYYQTGEYRKIIPMQRISAVMSFASSKGRAVPASYYGMPGDWPPETVITVTFQEWDGKTRMIVQESGIPEEMRVLTAQGWNESLEKLEEFLK